MDGQTAKKEDAESAPGKNDQVKLCLSLLTACWFFLEKKNVQVSSSMAHASCHTKTQRKNYKEIRKM